MEIELPDGTILDAPDNADPSAVAKAYFSKQKRAAPEGQSAASQAASAFMRPIIKGVSGLPGMMADAGVGVRNVAENAVNRYAPKLADSIYAMNRKLAGKSDVAASILPGGPPAGNYEGLTPAFDRAIDATYAPPEGLMSKGAELVSSTLVGSRMPAPEIANPAPPGFTPAAQALKDAALQAAQKEGYVVPPSSNNPSFGNRLMEGIAGKAKLSQEAMMRNQPVTESLAARALGQNTDVPITQGALSEIRGAAAEAGYGPVRAAGQMTADAKFSSDLSGLTKVGEGATRMGVKSSNPADAVIAALKDNKTFDASDGVDTIQYLRTLADDAYGAGQKSVGKAYKSAAKALEDLIERNLSARGEDGQALLKGFRGSRQLMAQTYTAGKALTDAEGTVNALSYGNAVKKGLPLVGDQKTIGDFAARFGKFAGVPKEIYPSISPLDVYGSAISAGATGSPLPLMLPLTRVGLREYLLSQAGQARAIPQSFRPPQNIGAIPSLMTQLPGLMAGS